VVVQIRTKSVIIENIRQERTAENRLEEKTVIIQSEWSKA
jgi:hypothetical protein